MATNKERALTLLYDAFSKGRRYSSAELNVLFDRHDLTYSERSLSRWLQHLREEHDLPVHFNRSIGRYEMLEVNEPASPTGLLKYTLDSQFLRDMLLRNQRAAEVIQPDN